MFCFYRISIWNSNLIFNCILLIGKILLKDSELYVLKVDLKIIEKVKGEEKFKDGGNVKL